jgi:uncharacterized protein (DUF302 family)
MSIPANSTYGEVRPTDLNFNQAVSQLEAALKQEGFGVLSHIDIQAKLKEKLGVEFPRYLILGACNPALAHQALQEDPNLGLLLPCNAVVYERAGKVHIGVVDAVKMLSVTDHPEMKQIALQANARLHRALDAVAPPASSTT